MSIAYAVRHPERVTKLVLYGGYAVGWRKRDDREIHEALMTLIRTGLGDRESGLSASLHLALHPRR